MLSVSRSAELREQAVVVAGRDVVEDPAACADRERRAAVLAATHQRWSICRNGQSGSATSGFSSCVNVGAASLEDTAARSERHFAVAQAAKPDVILLAHGAAIVGPSDGQYMLDHTRCHGVQLGSGIPHSVITSIQGQLARA